MDSLRAFLNDKIRIDQEDWQHIADSFHYEEEAKNAILTNQGSIENRLYFLVEGVVHLYHDDGEKDITINGLLSR